MRAILLSFSFLFSSLVLAQLKDCNNVNFDYASCDELYLNFDSIGIDNVKIPWKKAQNLKSVEIYGYSSKSKSLKGFEKASFKNLAVNYSDLFSFFSKNQLPVSIEKLTIWLNGEYGDTIVVPKEISTLVNLRFFSIGCCANLLFENCELSHFRKLDTLIVEGPVSNLKFLQGIPDLKYLGFWSPSLTNFKSQIDSILPNTKKEAWCFPAGQIIQMWDGEEKLIEHIQVGDTLVGYDFINSEIVPRIVERVKSHSSAKYFFGTIQSSDLLVSTEQNSTIQNTVSVTATIYHPLATKGGSVSVGDLIGGMQFYVLNSTGKVEIRTLDNIYFSCQSEEIYNLEISGENYFVGSVLFMEK